jgi:N-acetyl-anhydromuramyl-L-alanine amidase AmpD
MQQQLLRIACALTVAVSLGLASIKYLAASLPVTVMSAPRGVVIHHSAIAADHDTSAAEIDEYHRRRGFGVSFGGTTYHIGYHYLVHADGSIEAGRPEWLIGAHASGQNDSLGICLTGDFENGSSGPTDAAYAALLALTRDVISRYRLDPSTVVLHRDVTRTTLCPGQRFPAARFVHDLRQPSSVVVALQARAR